MCADFEPNCFNMTDTKSRSGLHWAAQQGHFHVVRFMHEKGADLNRESICGWTPFEPWSSIWSPKYF